MLIYDIKPTIIEASHDYKRNGENIEAERIIDLRPQTKAIKEIDEKAQPIIKEMLKLINND